MSGALEAIGFDLDGTLWDSTRTVAKTWKRVCENDMRVKKVPDAADIRGIMGMTLEGIAEKFFPYLSREEGLEILHRCCEEELKEILEEGGRLFEGLEETLKILSGRYRLYIVSNCHPGYIESFLTYHRLGQYFCDHEDHGRTGLPKGDNIRLVMERNGISRTVYVGDTQGDYNAARQAGVPFIHAAYGFGSVKETVPELTDIRCLPRLLENFVS